MTDDEAFALTNTNVWVLGRQDENSPSSALATRKDHGTPLLEAAAFCGHGQ